MRYFLLTLICRSTCLAYGAALVAIFAMSDVALGQNGTTSRLAYLLEQADRTTLTLSQEGDDPVELQRQPQPALKFTNPLNVGQADGVMLFWLDDDMPIVAASFYIRKSNEVFREFASLIESPLKGTRQGQVIWSPATSCFARQTLSAQMPPAENERLRLTQMKRAAERFSVKDMRLMPTPLYRYSSKKYGVIDGAVFGLVRATDPDVLILIEAVDQDSNTRGWRYAIGRMHSFALKVRLDDSEVCAFQPYWANPDPTLPYVEQLDSKLPDELKKPVSDKASTD